MLHCLTPSSSTCLKINVGKFKVVFGHLSRPVTVASCVDDGIEIVNGQVMLVAGTVAGGVVKSGLRPRKCKVYLPGVSGRYGGGGDRLDDQDRGSGFAFIFELYALTQ